jgi:aspartate ammonia-lyase
VVAKLASDLRLLSAGPTGGWAEVRLPHVLDGSTFFAGKRNPVVPETVMQVAIEVAAHHHAVQLAAERAELDLNVFDGLAALHVIDALDVLGPAIALLGEHAVAGLTIDTDRWNDRSPARTEVRT